MSKMPASLKAIQLATCLGFLVVQLDVSVVNVGLGSLKEAFNIDLTGLQWVINSYALVFSALLITGGAFGDKFGARHVFTWGFALFTLGSIGCGLASSMPMLIAMRSVQGIGAALLVPTSLTLIRLSFTDPAMRRMAVALWGACGGIALAAGPVLGGFLIQYLGWRSVFLINVPLGLLAIFLIHRFASPSARVDKNIDVFGQVSIAFCIAAMTCGLTELSAQGWTGMPTGMMFTAVIFFGVFVIIQKRIRYPMLPARLAKNKVLATTALCGAVINLTFYGTVFDLSIYFQSILHYDAITTGLSFIPLTAVLTISTMVSSRVAKKVSDIRIIITGFSIQIIGFVLLSQLAGNSSLWFLNAALMLVGIGSAMSVPSITNSMLSSISQHDAGMASGLMASARQLGGVIGVALFGAMIAHSGLSSFSSGMAHGMWTSVFCLLLCIVVNILVLRGENLPAKA
ncbi:MFS transporter [Acerihabitans sp. TG2]|uniref:MFS transporter n=1 Tax=Acerihabitans sp. TG2 TaxID=3096008 RepID=UPI002B222745|nr:MFS transporter [Acerihabitans sp. TG2]MEA9393520.1 MFS transporter [Acerihabitans sp. TG2]